MSHGEESVLILYSFKTKLLIYTQNFKNYMEEFLLPQFQFFETLYFAFFIF